MRGFLLLLLVIACAAQVAPISRGPESAPPAQTKPEDQGSVKGQVVNSATGEPVRKATVMMYRNSGAGEPYEAETDAGGNFSIGGVDPATYHVTANRNGFVMSSPGRAPRGGAPAVTVAARQAVEGITLKLLPQAVITGKVTDGDGEPVQSAQITVMRYGYMNGRRQLLPTGGSMTNDLGEYRIFGLAPEKVYIMASRANAFQMPVRGRRGPEESYPAIYYPSAFDPGGAAPIDLQPGAEVRGIDLRLQKSKAVRVTGHITGLTLGVGRFAMVNLVPHGESVFGMMGRNGGAVRTTDGAFEIRGVPPGSYTLRAEGRDESRPWTGRMQLEVGQGNIEDLTVAMAPSLELAGTIRYEGDPDVKGRAINLRLQPKDESMFGGGGAQVKPDNSFTVSNLLPDAYTVTVFSLPDNCYLKSVRFGTEDVTESGIDVTQGAAGKLELVVSNAGGQVSGTVTGGADQKPVSGATVVLVPEGTRRKIQSYFKQATTDQTGSYRLTGIAPGEYKLFAWETVEGGAYYDPEFLARYETKAEGIKIKEKATETKDLKVLE